MGYEAYIILFISKAQVNYLKLQPSSSFVETPCTPLNIEISPCGRMFSLPTLTRGKGGNVSTVVTKVSCRVSL